MYGEKYIQIGVLLLMCSFILGYGGLAVSVLLYLWTDNHHWLWAGSGVYGLSWIILGIGFIFSGKEGLVLIKKKLKMG